MARPAYRLLHRLSFAMTALAIARDWPRLWEVGGALELWCDERLAG
jgi:hypothetical protein